MNERDGLIRFTSCLTAVFVGLAALALAVIAGIQLNNQLHPRQAPLTAAEHIARCDQAHHLPALPDYDQPAVIGHCGWPVVTGAASDGYSTVTQHYYQNPTASEADGDYAAMVIGSACRKLSVQFFDAGMAGLAVLPAKTYYNGENDGSIPFWLKIPLKGDPLVIQLPSHFDLFDAFCV